MALGEFSQDPLLLEVWPLFSNVFAKPMGHAVLPLSTGVSEHGFPQPALDSVAQFVRRHPRIVIMLQLIETALADWQGLFRIHQYAWSLEMCTRCWAGQPEVRMHIHAFLRHEYRLRARSSSKSAGEVNVRWKSWAQGPMFEPWLVFRAVP